VSLSEAHDINGDRLLVDKNVFSLRRPRRWEMAVFHCPDNDPKEYRKPYVKRVVGLPDETLVIMDGEVYADGELLRKGLAELRETRVVIFDMAFTPPHGWNQRWLVDPPENDRRLPPISGRTAEPADSDVVDGGVLTLNAARPQTTTGVTYRNFNLDERKEETIRAWSSYDGLPRSFGQLPAVHNFSFECDAEVVSTSNEASFSCRLFDGTDGVEAEISVGPKANGILVLGHDGMETLAVTRGVSLEQGHIYRVEFSFVNRRVIFAIDGKVATSPVDLPVIPKRGEVQRPLQLGVRGCKLVIRNLKIYRDTYYTQFGEHGTQQPAIMGPAEYFMLGDNSSNSQDSRKWPTPGVPEGEFIGKPFLIHQPLRPARMTIGGEERLFQTVDWSRLRWLH
jgi:signal peptidase I